MDFNYASIQSELVNPMTIDLIRPSISKAHHAQQEDAYTFDVHQKIKSLEKEDEELTKKVELCWRQIAQCEKQPVI